MLRLDTDRLTLVAFTPELVRALAEEDRAAAAAVAGAALPDGWPDAELEGLLAAIGPWLEGDRARAGYGPWAIVAHEDNSVAGSVGFLSAPTDGEVEVGYGVHESYRRRGYATEAVRAVVEWVLAQPGVARVVASVAAGNEPSLRVMENAGFVRVGERDGSIDFARAR